MLRKFNYTNRIRILHEDARFSLRPEGGKWSFDASLNLEPYELPADALVFVEAYRQTTWMRFNFGTIDNCTPPDERLLSEFDSPEDILFRVRVTAPGSGEDRHGLLLAEANRVPLRSPEEVQSPSVSLLPVVPCELGAQLWKIDFVDHPRLLLNTAAGNYKQIGIEPGFISVVYPAALREILDRILHREERRDLDAEDWCSRWLTFASDVLGVGAPPESENGPEADDEWIDDAAASFAKKHDLLEKFRTFWMEAEK